MVKLKVKANMSNVLDKVKVGCLMPREYKSLPNWLLNSGHKASSSFKVIASNKSVIKSVNWGTSCLRTWNKPHVKMTRQTNKMDNLSILLFTMGIAFYCEVLH